MAAGPTARERAPCGVGTVRAGYRTPSGFLTAFFALAVFLVWGVALGPGFPSTQARLGAILCALIALAVFLRWLYAGVHVTANRVRVVNLARTRRIRREDVVRLELVPSRLRPDQMNGAIVTRAGVRIVVSRIVALGRGDSLSLAHEVLSQLGRELRVPVAPLNSSTGDASTPAPTLTR
jgi:hypothetical protein